MRGFWCRDPNNVKQKGTDGRTALHEAALIGRAAMAEFLLAKGAAVDVREDRGRYMPLHYAARSGRVEVAKLLLAAKATVELKDIDGKTPLDLARQQGHTEIENLLTGQA